MAGNGEDRTYTEAEHEALMAHALKTETAALAATKDELEAEVTKLKTQVDVLEAEKATLKADAENVAKEFEDFKADVERKTEIAALKTERAKSVKDANKALPDTYFTEDRVLAWAEMSEKAFEVVLDGIKATAATPQTQTRESAAFKEGEEISASSNTESGTAGRFLSVGKA